MPFGTPIDLYWNAIEIKVVSTINVVYNGKDHRVFNSCCFFFCILRGFFFSCVNTESENHICHGLTKTLSIAWRVIYLNYIIGFVVCAKTRLCEFVRFVQIKLIVWDITLHNLFYYMEESVLLGTKPLVDSIRHFIRDPSGVFSVCHLCECRIVQWRHDSRLLLLLNWFLASRLFSLHMIKRTLHGGSKI